VNLVLIGPPGCGKGTQALRLSRRFSIPHVSTGDILRQAVRDGSPLGQEVAATITRGELVGDTLMADLVRARLQRQDAAGGFILDGFPRTVAQAQILDEILDGRPLVIALIEVADDEIVKRLSSRRICESCNITQSVSDLSDGEAESCPYCGGSLVRREDDTSETVRNRLATYAAFAEPVVRFYRPRPTFLALNGLDQPEQVTRTLVREISRAAELLRG
jgi:adenylate kinase